MDISKIATAAEIDEQIRQELGPRAPTTLRDASAASLATPFVPQFAVESVSAFGCTNEGDGMYVQLLTKDGSQLVLEFETADCDAILEGIVRARAAARAVGAGEIGKIVLTGWSTWELGHMADGTAILFFDKGTPTQRAYPFSPGVASNVGRALVNVGRHAARTASRIVRN